MLNDASSFSERVGDGLWERKTSQMWEANDLMAEDGES